MIGDQPKRGLGIDLELRHLAPRVERIGFLPHLRLEHHHLGARGHGLSGLGRVFYAGAPTILASRWPIYDDVAARMTVDLIRTHAAGSASRAQALQSAMREIRKTHPHPGAWGPFALIGEGR